MHGTRNEHLRMAHNRSLSRRLACAGENSSKCGDGTSTGVFPQHVEFRGSRREKVRTRVHRARLGPPGGAGEARAGNRIGDEEDTERQASAAGDQLEMFSGRKPLAGFPRAQGRVRHTDLRRHMFQRKPLFLPPAVESPAKAAHVGTDFPEFTEARGWPGDSGGHTGIRDAFVGTRNTHSVTGLTSRAHSGDGAATDAKTQASQRRKRLTAPRSIGPFQPWRELRSSACSARAHSRARRRWRRNTQRHPLLP